MTDKDLELKLLAGIPIEIVNVGYLYVPTMLEIAKLGDSVYNQYLSALLFNKSSIEEIKGEEIDEFDLLFTVCYQNVEFGNIFFDAIKFYFKEEIQLGSDDSGFFFYFENNNRRIDKSNFAEIQRIIKKANYIKVDKTPEYKAGNSKAQEMIDLIEKNKKNKPQKKETMNLNSITSGLAWKSNGINIREIFELTIFQIYNGFFTTENIDNYSHTFTGIYTGNIKSEGIDFEKIHWAKVLDNN